MSEYAMEGGGRLETLYLTREEVGRAAHILRQGGLVGLPTETVYGLGANGLDAKAVAKIFQAKGRPQDNPLILHILELSWLEWCCRDIPPVAYRLAEQFWPGPLTLILPCNARIPLCVTGGRLTVGVRMPSHPLCREILQASQIPIAAPSGNRSGKPSPTTAAHMWEDMAGRVEAIVDGGPCAVGVESTILDLTCHPPCILRPGGVTREQLQEVLGEVTWSGSEVQEGEAPRAPGMKYPHYAPRAPVTLVTGDPQICARYIQENIREGEGVICFDEFRTLFHCYETKTIGPMENRTVQAQRIFEALRAFDHTAVKHIWSQCPSGDGMGMAVANRLKKAAGDRIIPLHSEG